MIIVVVRDNVLHAFFLTIILLFPHQQRHSLTIMNSFRILSPYFCNFIGDTFITVSFTSTDVNAVTFQGK